MIDKDSVEANLVNAGALGVGMMSIDKFLTVLVLGTALIYNVLKIISWYKKWQKEKAEEKIEKLPLEKDVQVATKSPQVRKKKQ